MYNGWHSIKLPSMQRNNKIRPIKKKNQSIQTDPLLTHMKYTGMYSTNSDVKGTIDIVLFC